MTIRYNVTGQDRKKLVQNISEILECDAKYLGMPSAAYRIGAFTVDREGTLTCDDMTETEQLIEELCDRGFEAEIETADAEEQPADECGLNIKMPRASFTEQALENLFSLVAAKGALLKKVLGTAELPLRSDESGEWVCFPWFHGEPTAEEVHAYTRLVEALCNMARNQKRITAKEKPVENEKYAFRCFLLRLGFIGDESKTDRKILLRNLSGNSAFLSGQKHAADNGEEGGERND